MSVTHWQWLFSPCIQKRMKGTEEYFSLILLYNSIKVTSKAVRAYILKTSLSQFI